ncbi:MAG TPA: CBS domain-containing protein [Mycobacteriales bacterium]|nr:CBS domain-containing protein [Mycobacteriales bacterium]
MLARDLADPDFPTVGLDHDAAAAARQLAERRLPGLVVVDDAGLPHSVLPGSQVLRFVIPGYVQDDPMLARVYDERHADALTAKLAGTPVRTLLRAERTEPPVVDGKATAVEIAAVMARLHSPLVAVVDQGRFLGVVTVGRLLERMLR